MHIPWRRSSDSGATRDTGPMSSTEVADWLVAGGTLALAAATYRLVRSTDRSVKTAAAQLGIERNRIEAGQTPRVFPAPPVAWIDGSPPYAGPIVWTEVIPVKN